MNLTNHIHRHPYPRPKPITKTTRPSTPRRSHKLPSPPSTTPLLHHLPPQQNHNKKSIPKSPKSNKQITTNLKPKTKLHSTTIETTTRNESLCKDWPKTHSHHAAAVQGLTQNPTTHYHRMPTSTATAVPHHRWTHHRPPTQTHFATTATQPRPPLQGRQHRIGGSTPTSAATTTTTRGFGFEKNRVLGLRRGETSYRTKARKRREDREMKERVLKREL